MNSTQRNFVIYPLSLFKIFSILILVSQSLSSADAAYCKSYAQNAVQQYNTAQSTGMPTPPPAWSGDYNGHYNWCLIAPQNIVQNEHNIRAQAIQKYSAQSVAPKLATPPSSIVLPLGGIIMPVPKAQSLPQPVKSAPSIGTSFMSEYDKSDSECRTRGIGGLVLAGFVNDYIVAPSWVFASSGSYRGLVECTNSRMVIVVAGPDKIEADKHKYRIRKFIKSKIAIENNRFPNPFAYSGPKAPNIGTSYFETDRASGSVARDTLIRSGFTSDIIAGPNWAFASRGSYRGLIEYVGDDTMLIVVSGPDKNRCDKEKYIIRSTESAKTIRGSM